MDYNTAAPNDFPVRGRGETRHQLRQVFCEEGQELQIRFANRNPNDPCPSTSWASNYKSYSQNKAAWPIHPPFLPPRGNRVFVRPPSVVTPEEEKNRVQHSAFQRLGPPPSRHRVWIRPNTLEPTEDEDMPDAVPLPTPRSEMPLRGETYDQPVRSHQTRKIIPISAPSSTYRQNIQKAIDTKKLQINCPGYLHGKMSNRLVNLPTSSKSVPPRPPFKKNWRSKVNEYHHRITSQHNSTLSQMNSVFVFSSAPSSTNSQKIQEDIAEQLQSSTNQDVNASCAVPFPNWNDISNRSLKRRWEGKVDELDQPSASKKRKMNYSPDDNIAHEINYTLSLLMFKQDISKH